jgi:hypothetical protein
MERSLMLTMVGLVVGGDFGSGWVVSGQADETLLDHRFCDFYVCTLIGQALTSVVDIHEL